MKRGFIAVISILITSSFLLMAVLAAASFGLYARLSSLEQDTKLYEREALSSCAESLALMLESGQTVTGVRIPVGGLVCVANEHTASSNTRSFSLAKEGGVSTVYIYTVNTQDFSTVSLTETSSVPN